MNFWRTQWVDLHRTSCRYSCTNYLGLKLLVSVMTWLHPACRRQSVILLYKKTQGSQCQTFVFKRLKWHQVACCVRIQLNFNLILGFGKPMRAASSLPVASLSGHYRNWWIIMPEIQTDSVGVSGSHVCRWEVLKYSIKNKIDCLFITFFVAVDFVLQNHPKWTRISIKAMIFMKQNLRKL